MAEIEAGLDPKTRAIATALSANPLDVIQGELKGYLEDFIRITVGPPKNWTPPIGTSLVIMDDLTAHTGEWVVTDDWGVSYLYANGAAVSQTTYAALYAKWGASKWGADSGGNFLLPDARGRSLFFCGTNAAADLGDNDGVAEASRQAKHSPEAGNLTVTGAPSIGTLGVSGGPYVDGSAGTLSGLEAATASRVTSTSSPALSGAPGLGTLGVGGTIGSGMTGDGPAHLFIGSLLVRF